MSLRAFDKTDGHVIKAFKQSTGGNGVLQGAIAADDNHVYFGTQGATNYCLTRTGTDLVVQVACTSATTHPGRMLGIAVRDVGATHNVYVAEDDLLANPR